MKEYIAECKEISKRGTVDVQALINGTLPEGTPGIEKVYPVPEELVRYQNKRIDPENRVINDTEYTYDENVDLRERNAKIAEKIVEKRAILLKNEGALPLVKEDYQGENRVTLIGLGSIYPICGYGQERSYGTLKYMASPQEELRKRSDVGANISAEIGLDYVGSCIPEAVLLWSGRETCMGFRDISESAKRTVSVRQR